MTMQMKTRRVMTMGVMTMGTTMEMGARSPRTVLARSAHRTVRGTLRQASSRHTPRNPMRRATNMRGRCSNWWTRVT